MSHINSIGGFETAAADYQAYLARMRSRKKNEESSEVSKDTPLTTFDSAIDADAKADEDHEGGDQPDPNPDPDPDSNRRYA